MIAWKPKIRTYPHFDAMMTSQRVLSLVTNPAAIARHTFFPFLKYSEHWTQFAPKGRVGKVKERPIRFAARLDSCIFSYYRHLLSAPYEELLTQSGLDASVLAYRRVAKVGGSGGQCNIDFALSAFRAVQNYRNCCTIALDISSFFESLDHERLRQVWAGLIGCDRLPEDHFSVFEAMSRYSFVEVIAAYERLGYYGPKVDKNGKTRSGYLVSKKDIPVQLCNGAVFRRKIAGSAGLPSIINTNKSGRGVPQGAPLSDLLANAYLFDFDKEISAICHSLGGTYLRYSDDILIVVPIDQIDALLLETEVRNKITKYGSHLTIKEEKSAVHQFSSVGHRQVATAVKPAGSPGKPFEYLGFRFDGRYAFIRDKTMSGLHRKVAKVCRAKAVQLSKRYRGKSIDDLFSLANIDKLVQAFGPVEDFAAKSDDYRSWTFTTYAKRASRTLGPLGTPVRRQVLGLRAAVENRLRRELHKLAK